MSQPSSGLVLSQRYRAGCVQMLQARNVSVLKMSRADFAVQGQLCPNASGKKCLRAEDVSGLILPGGLNTYMVFQVLYLLWCILC